MKHGIYIYIYIYRQASSEARQSGDGNNAVEALLWLSILEPAAAEQ